MLFRHGLVIGSCRTYNIVLARLCLTYRESLAMRMFSKFVSCTIIQNLCNPPTLCWRFSNMFFRYMIVQVLGRMHEQGCHILQESHFPSPWIRVLQSYVKQSILVLNCLLLVSKQNSLYFKFLFKAMASKMFWLKHIAYDLVMRSMNVTRPNFRRCRGVTRS